MLRNYCMECKAPLTRKDETDFICANGHEFWNNPLGAASVLFIKDGQVLLTRRGHNPHKGKYNFVGSFINFGEGPYAAARREALEETGARVGELHLLEVFTTGYSATMTTCDIFFACHDWQGSLVAADDAAALEWQTIDFLETSDQFAWPKPALAEKLRTFSRGNGASMGTMEQ